MRILFLFFILGLVFPVYSQALEKKLKYKKLLKYEEVLITKVTPSYISIIHKNGARTIPIEDLPQSIRINLGMSLDSAIIHREKIKQRQKLATQRAKMKHVLARKRLIFSGTVFQVTDRGLLLKEVSYTDGSKEEKKIPYKVRTGGGPNGLNPHRSYKYATRYKSKWVLKVRRLDTWPIFVECDTAGYIDGGSFTGVVYSDGTFSYETIRNARRTIPAYTTNASKVLKNSGF